MAKFDSQNARIATYLKGGGRLTPMDALDMFGCFRLSARIANLKAEGMNIKTELITRNGKTFAQYRLIE